MREHGHRADILLTELLVVVRDSAQLVHGVRNRGLPPDEEQMLTTQLAELAVVEQRLKLTLDGLSSKTTRVARVAAEDTDRVRDLAARLDRIRETNPPVVATFDLASQVLSTCALLQAKGGGSRDWDC